MRNDGSQCASTPHPCIRAKPDRLIRGQFSRLALAALSLSGGAASAATSQGAPVAFQPSRAPYQAVSLLGDTLRAFPLSNATRVRYEAQLATARRAYESTPANLDSIVWYGRRLAYLGLLREAIAVYTYGLTVHPDNPWLLRHRGHRYLSVREFDHAIADLERAAAVTMGKPDEVEPDGQPNARGVPIGTLQSNIGYHLALAYYLKGDWARAADVAQREVRAATNDDRRVSMVHWQYMALRRAGRDADAAKALDAFRRPLSVIENQSYEQLIRLYLGDTSVVAALGGVTGTPSSADASLAYGIANWHFYNGRRWEAVRLFRQLVSGGQWGAFGSIAAEAELARFGAPRP
jgi:tetratricopeptide (TPR) repeat protein